jgi:hypothetical protein
MGSSTISLGLGLGGGKAATSSGRLAGGGGFVNEFSISLDGTDDFMSAGNITAVNSVANASYSFWYKTSATGKVGLLGGGVGTSAYHWDNGTMYVHSWVDNESHAITIPTLEAWHHIVCTFEASGSKLYVDGSLQSSQDRGDITASDAGNGFQVGRVPHYSIPDGQKLVDEFALFTSTLTAGQITNIYKGEVNGGSGGTNGVPGDLNTFSPIAWWRMGDINGASGVTITDQGSGGNNGTLENGPTYSTSVPS